MSEDERRSADPTASDAAVGDLAHLEDFGLGDLKVQPSLRRVVGPQSSVDLEPKVMQLLAAFHRHSGEVLSRDDLFRLCWGERIVGDGSLDRVLSLLRAAIRDSGSQKVSIQTVPRVGYRLRIEGAAAGESGGAGEPPPRLSVSATLLARGAGGASSGGPGAAGRPGTACGGDAATP